MASNHLASYRELKCRVRPTLAFLLLAFACSPPAFPAPAAQPVVQTYDQLIHAIREARAASEQRFEQEKVRLAWETGKLIDRHVLQHKERADYAKNVVIRLAKDLGMSSTELYYMLEFARTYSILPTSGELTWSHYRELLAINDPDQREQVTRQAEKEKWDVQRVRINVRRINASKGSKNSSSEKLEAVQGKTGTYRVILAKAGPYQGALALDLGFSSYYKPDKKLKLREGDIVQQDPGRGSGLRKIPDATIAALYTYHAYVTQVIDGDTFHALIDLGFGFVIEQKLRLRGLDAPEIESTDGREAKAFLEKQLTRKRAPILIRTVKSDKYDRYLADVWVGETYVNQKLIDKGLAVKVSE